MPAVRRQLTLFVYNEAIELIRLKYNPQQYNLISAHVTLCREDEIEDLERVFKNLNALKLNKPLCLKFLSPERFDNGKGLYMPSSGNNIEFDMLRKVILGGIIESTRKHLPHITLMHPRNSTCTDSIFDEIKDVALPSEIKFDKIILIEQHFDNAWRIIKEFSMG